MHAFIVRLRAEEPLVIPSGSSKNMAQETLGYIPGSMLLGAFVTAWKRAHRGMAPDASPDFCRLFLDGSVSWGTAVPLCGSEPGIPIPRCYMRLKNRKGLPHVDENIDGHTVINLLRSTEDNNLTQDLRDKGILGPHEVLKLKKLSTAFMGRSNMRVSDDKRGWNIHVALGSQRSALEGQLFGYSSIPAGTEFHCRIICRDTQTEQDLDTLLSGTTSFHVGLSRSAGYGQVRIVELHNEKHETRTVHIQAGQETAVYMLSHYMPSPSWLRPVESLLNELEQRCGERPVLKKLFCTYVSMNGYNALWDKPRTSRLALEQGSVLLCSFGSDVQLPASLMLGADQGEGYGRIEMAPPFLDRLFPSVPSEGTRPPQKVAQPPSPSPYWCIIRRRALDKKCKDRVYSMLLEDRWQKFLRAVTQNTHPSASQRGNIRHIITELPAGKWRQAFCDLLDNSSSAAEQWKETAAPCPFSGKNEYLNEIMKRLLSEELRKEFRPETELRSGPATEEEMHRACLKAHRLFLQRLLIAWNHPIPQPTEAGRN